MLGSHEARIDFHATALNAVVVKPLAELCAAQLLDLQAAPLDAIFPFCAFHQNHAVGDALELLIVAFAGAIVQQQHGAFASGKILFQAQNLTAITEGVARQQTQFRERIEHHADRLQSLDFRHDGVGGVGHFDFGRIEDRVLGLRPELRLIGSQFKYFDLIERPVVRIGDLQQFRFRFRKSDVEALLATTDTLHEELHGNGGLAGSWIALDEVEVITGESPSQNVVQARDPGGESLLGRRSPVVFNPAPVS